MVYMRLHLVSALDARQRLVPVLGVCLSTHGATGLRGIRGLELSEID